MFHCLLNYHFIIIHFTETVLVETLDVSCVEVYVLHNVRKYDALKYEQDMTVRCGSDL